MLSKVNVTTGRGKLMLFNVVLFRMVRERESGHNLR